MFECSRSIGENPVEPVVDEGHEVRVGRVEIRQRRRRVDHRAAAISRRLPLVITGCEHKQQHEHRLLKELRHNVYTRTRTYTSAFSAL